MTWRSLLPQIIQSGQYRRQSDLVRALADRGYEVNQGTVSRELTARGITKQEGVYRLPEEGVPGAPVYGLQVTANGCLAVLHTEPAHASVLGQFVDGARLEGVLGTIAGDDTVFVALADGRAEAALRELLGLRR